MSALCICPNCVAFDPEDPASLGGTCAEKFVAFWESRATVVVCQHTQAPFAGGLCRCQEETP